jgi:hypothetical protein
MMDKQNEIWQPLVTEPCQDHGTKQGTGEPPKLWPRFVPRPVWLLLGVQIFGFTLSVAAELLIVAALGVIFVSWAALSFGKQE